MRDAVIVLGLKLEDGKPTEELKERAMAAARLWIEGKAPIIIACGGRANEGQPSEAETIAALLMECGVPPTVIKVESESVNTLQNITNAKAIMDTFGGKSCYVVTCAYHMKRALAICKDMRLDAYGVISCDGRSFRNWCMEVLGWIAYKFGLQSGGEGMLHKWMRKITRT